MGHQYYQGSFSWEETIQGFSLAEGKPPELVILAGGAALTPGLKEYFSEKLGKKTEIANPFQNIFYPPILEDTLIKLAPSHAIAVGSAIRGLE